MKRKTKLITLFIGLIIVTVVLLAVALKVHACAWYGCGSGDFIFLQEQSAIENNQQKMDQVRPIPYMTDSEERKNLIKRAQTFNNPNKISYIYLYSFGKLIMYDTVKGKVSAVDSSLTPGGS